MSVSQYAYTVSYSEDSILQKKLNGYKPKGYEELSVCQRKPPNKSGKPILLFGNFAHCASGQLIVYRGTAVFCSSKHLSEIRISTTDSRSPKLKQAIQILKNEQNS